MSIPGNKTVTQLRIERALAKPGATGMRGFLLWVEAAFPPTVARPILKAAQKYAGGPPVAGGLGRLGDWTDTSSGAADPTNPPISATTATASSDAATPAWAADVSTAIQTGLQVYQLASQQQAANQLFQVNLQRAQMGLPPVATDPTRYGLPAPTVNVGMTTSTENTVLVIGALLVGAFLLHSLGKKR